MPYAAAIDTATGIAHHTKKCPKPSRPTCPISMFCGLPISVAAEPMLLAQASPMRYGMGFRRARSTVTARTGVKARQTISFTNTAESEPLTSISSSRKRLGRAVSPPSASAARV